MSEEWNEEDEFVDADSTEEVSQTLPDGVMERVEAVTEQYLNYIKDEFGCENPYEQDEDLLEDWAESCFVVHRSSGGGGGGVTFLGSIIGIGDKKNDRLENLRALYIREFSNDPAQMIDSGRLGV